jgi:hypothetical protein
MAENRRAVVALGVIGALVLAFALWHFVLDGGGGGSNSATGTTIPGIAATTPIPSTTTTAGGSGGTGGGGVSVDIVTNPFLPKYVAPADTSGTTTGGTTGGTTIDTGGATATTAYNPGTVPTGTTFTPAITTPPNVTEAPATSGLPTSLDQNIQTIKAVTVQLLSIQTAFGLPAATVKLGDKTDTVVVGQTFETSYRLLGLTDRCGTFVYGDSPFQVCVGETAAKQ